MPASQTLLSIYPDLAPDLALALHPEPCCLVSAPLFLIPVMAHPLFASSLLPGLSMFLILNGLYYTGQIPGAPHGLHVSHEECGLSRQVVQCSLKRGSGLCMKHAGEG